MVMGYLVAAAPASAQLSATDSLEVAVQAIWFLKGSEEAARWHGGFRLAEAATVIAAGVPLGAASLDTSEARRIQQGAEQVAGFTIAGRSWPCLRPDRQVAARCALEHVRFYVHVGTVFIRDESVYVPVALFVKDVNSESGMRRLSTFVQFVREESRWRAQRVLLVVLQALRVKALGEAPRSPARHGGTEGPRFVMTSLLERRTWRFPGS